MRAFIVRNKVFWCILQHVCNKEPRQIVVVLIPASISRDHGTFGTCNLHVAGSFRDFGLMVARFYGTGTPQVTIQ